MMAKRRNSAAVRWLLWGMTHHEAAQRPRLCNELLGPTMKPSRKPGKSDFKAIQHKSHDPCHRVI